MSSEQLWEEIISNISRVGKILPEAVVVGGTASAIYAGHRTSFDTDFVLLNLKDTFEEVLNSLEEIVGWKTTKIKPPVLILGNFMGVKTGIRQLIRQKPIDTTDMNYLGHQIKVPTLEEILRIKGFLIIQRNATRDYLDFIALAEHLGDKTYDGLKDFDDYYSTANAQSCLKQLLIQLSNPMPYDIKEVELSKYKNLKEEFHNWQIVVQKAQAIANKCFIMLENPNNKIEHLKNKI